MTSTRINIDLGVAIGSPPARLDAIPLPAFVVERNWRLVGCNSRLLDLVGLPAEQVLGRTPGESIFTLIGITRGCDSAPLGISAPVTLEGQLTRTDGERRDVEIHGSPVTDDAGAVESLLCVIVDVTARRRAERSLVESEDRFARLVEITHEGVLVHSRGRILDVNGSLCRMTGWTREQLLGQSHELLFPPESMQVARQGVTWCRDDVYRVSLRRRDGSTFVGELHGRNVTCEGQELRVVTIRDISDLLAAEAAQREREEMYRQMFETNQAVKLLIDPADGRIMDANPSAERFYGWSRQTLRAMRITDINCLPPDQVALEMTRAKEEARLFFRFRHRVASGGIRDVEVYSGPVTYHGRRLLHSIIHDVTDRNRYQRELERKTAQLETSNADLEQFAYVASHDLKEPLRTVVSYLQLLERRYKGRLDSDADEFIDFAVQAAKRMGEMIQGLLEYCRVDSQAHSFDQVDLNRVLAAVLGNLRFAIDQSGAEIRAAELPTVRGDEGQLSSLLQNLLGNGLKYRHRDRRPVLELGARLVDDRWELSLTDNGIGIASEYHEQIFMLFKRLHGVGQYDGTGIGLAVCKRIVTRHGGRIWVESREGEGSTFRFTLLAEGTPSGEVSN